MEHELVAFLDESRKPVRDRRTRRVSDQGEFYVVAAAVILSGDVDDARSILLDIEARLGYSLHYNDLSHARRVEVVEAVVEIDCWDGYLFETESPLQAKHYSESWIRAKTLEESFTSLSSGGGVTTLVLETRSQPSSGFTKLDLDDHRIVQRLHSRGQVPADFSIRHGNKTDPLLWLADILAGARSDHLCANYEDVFPRLGHRVAETRSVFKKRP